MKRKDLEEFKSRLERKRYDLDQNIKIAKNDAQFKLNAFNDTASKYKKVYAPKATIKDWLEIALLALVGCGLLAAGFVLPVSPVLIGAFIGSGAGFGVSAALDLTLTMQLKVFKRKKNLPEIERLEDLMVKQTIDYQVAALNVVRMEKEGAFIDRQIKAAETELTSLLENETTLQVIEDEENEQKQQ